VRKIIYCVFNLFDLNQTINLVNLENSETTAIATTSLDTLPETLCTLADTYKVYNIHLMGDEAYGKKVYEDTLTFAQTNYSNLKLNIQFN
jgi:hypothetical protein